MNLSALKIVVEHVFAGVEGYILLFSSLAVS